MLHFSLRVSQNSVPRIGASVSKKVAKKAVTRNLIKRRIRAATRALLPTLKPAEYLVSARSGAEKLSYTELRAELALLFKKG